MLNSSIVSYRPLGRPRTTWIKTIQQDLKSNNLSLNEATDMAQNHPLWTLVVHDRNDDDDDDDLNAQH